MSAEQHLPYHQQFPTTDSGDIFNHSYTEQENAKLSPLQRQEELAQRRMLQAFRSYCAQPELHLDLTSRQSSDEPALAYAAHDFIATAVEKRLEEWRLQSHARIPYAAAHRGQITTYLERFYSQFGPAPDNPDSVRSTQRQHYLVHSRALANSRRVLINGALVYPEVMIAEKLQRLLRDQEMPVAANAIEGLLGAYGQRIGQLNSFTGSAALHHHSKDRHGVIRRFQIPDEHR